MRKPVFSLGEILSTVCDVAEMLLMLEIDVRKVRIIYITCGYFLNPFHILLYRLLISRSDF